MADISAIFEALLCDGTTGYPDNSGSPGGRIVDFGLADIPTRTANILDLLDIHPDCSVIYYADHTTLDDRYNTPWAARVKIPLSIWDTHYLSVSDNFTLGLSITNLEADKYLTFYVDYSSHKLILANEDGIVWQSTETFVSQVWQYFTVHVHAGLATFMFSFVQDVCIELTYTVDLRYIFYTEDIYLGIMQPYSGYLYFQKYLTFASAILAHNTELNQLANATITATLQLFEAELRDLVVTYVCYYKDRVHNSGNLSDQNALTSLNPDYPSVLGEPLKVGDTCIVIDAYNRFFLYTVTSGFKDTKLPHTIKLSDTLYWALTEYISNISVLVEQYNLNGLSSSNEIIIQHTPHNRTNSFAPVVQIRHNDVIITNGLIVSVISNTSLRFRTTQEEAFDNLYVNLYIAL